MASILELVFNGKVTVQDVTAWLAKESSCSTLDDASLVQAEFVQYFLNFLRDQSAPILQGCRSANATPSKTPTVLKSQRSITFGEPALKTSTPRNTGESKRVQLFAASPLEGDSLTHPIDETRTATSHNGSSLNCPSFNSPRSSSVHENTGWSLNNSHSTTTSPHSCTTASNSYLQRSPLKGSQQVSSHPGSASRRASNRSTPESFAQGKRNRNNSTGPVYTPDSQRSHHKHSLGEFVVVSNTRKKKSPTAARHEDISPQKSPGGWKAGVKVKGYGSSEKKWWQPVATDASSPVFALNNNQDFPSLGIPSSTTSASVDVRPQSLGSKEVNPIRRIAPTAVPQVMQSKESRSPAGTNTRRITPIAVVTHVSGKAMHTTFTSLSAPKQEDDEECPNVAFPVTPDPPVVSLEAERKLLREVRVKGLAPEVTEETTPQKTLRLREMLAKQFTPTKLVVDQICSVMDSLPELSHVTFQDRLDVMSELYSLCLKEYMVPNVTVELYFVVQLLTTRGLDADLAVNYLNQDDDEEVCYLASVHNAVYFAVSVLQKQQRLLSLLDKGTLRLIVDNQRISDFCPAFRDDLLRIIEKTRMKVRPLPPSSPLLGVSFQADTDNRKNFPDDRAFHTFKKQRDNFYELLREWQDYHMQPRWSMRDAHGARIRDLVGSHIELTNHVHFARLFQSQLIMMCKGDRSHKVEGDDENISLLSELRLSNPAKFKRLQERFISPQSVGSPCPHPSFPGCQEFFRDFVIIASSHMFNHHLTHTMVERIAELNGTTFSLAEGESEQEAEVDPEDLETMSMCLLTLRLLGKFLGFVTFLPYQSSEKLPDTMEIAIINMRNQVPLPVNPETTIHQCLLRGRTVLTMPWIVEFLSMMDALAPRLDQLQQALGLLVHVYRSVARELCEGRRTLTLLLVITSLGWLFELPVFPEGMFFKSFPYGISQTAQLYGSMDCADKMDLVDHSLFFTCCPYVAEVKSLLMGFAVGSNNKGSSIRKITPMMTESDVSGSMFEKHLQAHLEESFFHNHPASMKRTLDFVADRVASNYIKKFRAGHLPKLVQTGSHKLKAIIQALGGGFDIRAKRKARQQVEDLSLELVTRAHALSCGEVFRYVSTQSGAILPLMLPEETSPQVISVATDISTRLGKDKVVAWMSTHITKAMFVREYSPELEKYLKVATLEQIRGMPGGGVPGGGVPGGGCPGWEAVAGLSVPQSASLTSGRPEVRPVTVSARHDVGGCFPSEILVEFKELLRDLVLGECSLTSDDAIYQVGRIRWCLENRQDIISGVFKCMARMTIDMAYVLALRYPSLWTPPVKDALLDIWKNHLRIYTNFTHVICAKHLHFISTAPNDQLAWQNLCDLVITLLDNTLATAADVETHARAITQTALPTWISTEVERFISERVSHYRINPGSDVTKETSQVANEVVVTSTDSKGGTQHGAVSSTVQQPTSRNAPQPDIPSDAYVCSSITPQKETLCGDACPSETAGGTTLPPTSGPADSAPWDCDSGAAPTSVFCDLNNARLSHHAMRNGGAAGLSATVESALTASVAGAQPVGWSVVVAPLT